MPIQKITSGIIQDGAVAAADIVSVSNTAITGNIISSQIAPNQTLNGNVTLSSTGHVQLPSGTTAQRPGSPVVGMIRYNSTTSFYEVYTSAGWAILGATAYDYAVDYLVIAGAGGGGGPSGGNYGGGGGAGGYRTSVGTSGGGGSAESALTLSFGTTYTITVGAGGATNVVGSNSVFSTITSLGGGRGGYDGGTVTPQAGGTGGSGGGGTGGSGGAGSGTANQGFNGSAGNGGSQPPGGAGGGAGGAGGATVSDGAGGAGGAGVSSSITGSSVTRGGGGGGGAGISRAGGAGGSGGGGAGGTQTVSGTAGTTNTGGGGGGQGGSAGGATTGGAGGSGVVILSIPTTRYSGTTTGSPTVTTSGSNTILTFTGSGSYTA